MKKRVARICLAMALLGAVSGFAACGDDGDEKSPSNEDTEYGNDYENPDYDSDFNDFVGDASDF